MAGNRAQTTMSYGGKFTSEWPDGEVSTQNRSFFLALIHPRSQQHPEGYNGYDNLGGETPLPGNEGW
jgi:hypothetical protein